MMDITTQQVLLITLMFAPSFIQQVDETAKNSALQIPCYA